MGMYDTPFMTMGEEFVWVVVGVGAGFGGVGREGGVVLVPVALVVFCVVVVVFCVVVVATFAFVPCDVPLVGRGGFPAAAR
jgi:hypothetical protein